MEIQLAQKWRLGKWTAGLNSTNEHTVNESNSGNSASILQSEMECSHRSQSGESGRQNSSKEEHRRQLVNINELNERFMRNNLYYVGIAVFLYIMFGVAVYHHWLDWSQF